MGEPKCENQPMVMEETPGKKAYCQCGHSEKLPYCDGAHSQACPGISPMVVEVTEAGKKAVCMCHRSEKLPWCDGSHSRS